MARAIRLMAEARSPVRVKKLHEVDTALRKLESIVSSLSKEFEEVVSNSTKIAIVTAMMPVQVQDYVYTHVTEKVQYMEQQCDNDVQTSKAALCLRKKWCHLQSKMFYFFGNLLGVILQG